MHLNRLTNIDTSSVYPRRLPVSNSFTYSLGSSHQTAIGSIGVSGQPAVFQSLREAWEWPQSLLINLGLGKEQASKGSILLLLAQQWECKELHCGYWHCVLCRSKQGVFPMRLSDTQIWAMAERLCSRLAYRDPLKYPKRACQKWPPLMNCKIVQMFSFLELHPVSEDWGSKLNEELTNEIPLSSFFFSCVQIRSRRYYSWRTFNFF